MQSLRLFSVLLILLLFLPGMGYALSGAAIDKSSTFDRMEKFQISMLQKNIARTICTADYHQEFRLSTTRNFSGYMYPQISDDIVTWWEFDQTTHPGTYVQVANLAAETVVRFLGDHPSVNGHNVAFSTIETSQSSHTWSQLWIYNTTTGQTTPLLLKMPFVDRGLINDIAINGNRILWVSWTSAINAQGSLSGKERIYSYDLLTGSETALTPEFPVETRVVYGLKALDGNAVWINDWGGMLPHRTITLMDLQKNAEEDLGYLDPGLNQTFPDIEGNYIVWIASKQDSDVQKEIVLYDISTHKIIKRLPALRPGPPVLSNGRILWTETAHINVYYVAANYTQTFAPQHRPVNSQMNNRLIGYSGWIDASNSNVVYFGESENGGDVFLYDLEMTPCISIPNPVIKASSEDGYAPLTVTFDGSASTSKTGSIQTCFWTLPLPSGKVTTTTGPKVTHTFTQPGTYRVDLTVTDVDGKEAKASQYIVVLNPDEIRITRDPLWNQEFPRIHGDYLCWLEIYFKDVTQDELMFNPDLKSSTMRIAAYNLKTGERKILGPTDNMYCDVSDSFIAYIGSDQTIKSDPDRLRVFSLPGMNPAGTWEIGMGRRAQVSGSNVVWEEFVSQPTLKNPGDTAATLGELQPWQGDIHLLTLSNSPSGYINLTKDSADNNWPVIDKNIVVWVDYFDLRTWPDKKPMLWVLNITSGEKFSIPTDAVQIEPVVEGDRVFWINNWAKSRYSLDGWNSTLYWYNLTTGAKEFIRILGPSDTRLVVFGNKIYWEDDTGKIHQFDLKTSQDSIVSLPYTVDGGFDPYCDLVAFADRRTGDYDIYIKLLPGTPPAGCMAHNAKDLYSAAQPKPQTGGSILIWNPIEWVIGVFRNFFTPPSLTPPPTPSTLEVPPTSPPTGNSCDDRNLCTVNDQLIQGVCRGTPLKCDDGNAETTDTCDPASGCVFTPIRASCDDQNRCTVNDRWVNGICQGDPFVCDDGNPETQDSCDPQSGCIFTPILTTPAEYAPCDDDNACTVNDRIVQGVCIGSPLTCDDGNPETQDSCDPRSGCIFTLITPTGGEYLPCDDENACTENDRIIRGVCRGTPVVCDDGNPRTQDTCDPASGCIFSPITMTPTTPSQVCPEGCTCLSPSEALQIYGHALRCSDTPCAADYSIPTRVLYKYCYRPAG
jgi:PKD repeat protein